MDLRVLTWNLFHGRAAPPPAESERSAGRQRRAGRDLYLEFANALEGWEWDVALRAAASCDADHVLCGEGIEVRTATVMRLERGGPSDHAPLAVTLVI